MNVVRLRMWRASATAGVREIGTRSVAVKGDAGADIGSLCGDNPPSRSVCLRSK